MIICVVSDKYECEGKSAVVSVSWLQGDQWTWWLVLQISASWRSYDTEDMSVTENIVEEVKKLTDDDKDKAGDDKPKEDAEDNKKQEEKVEDAQKKVDEAEVSIEQLEK